MRPPDFFIPLGQARHRYIKVQGFEDSIHGVHLTYTSVYQNQIRQFLFFVHKS